MLSFYGHAHSHLNKTVTSLLCAQLYTVVEKASVLLLKTHASHLDI